MEKKTTNEAEMEHIPLKGKDLVLEFPATLLIH